MRLRKPIVSTKLTAEEQRLSKEQQATLLRMEQLEKELQAYPKQIEEKKARHRERVKMQAELAAPAPPGLVCSVLNINLKEFACFTVTDNEIICQRLCCCA